MKTLAGLLARIEREPFTSPRLRELGDELPWRVRGSRASVPDRPPGEAGDSGLEARHNVYFALFGSFFLWKTQFALAVEAWREAEGAAIGRWLEVVGQVEASPRSRLLLA